MGQAEACRVLVVDDNPGVHRSVEVLVGAAGHFGICGRALDGFQAIDLTFELKPTLILMDVNMPRCTGIEATRHIRHFNSVAKVLFYSGHPDSAEGALAAGGNGFVTKAAPCFTLRTAMEAVIHGAFYVDSIPWAALKAHFSSSAYNRNGWNPEQQNVAKLLVQGLTTKEIAVQLSKNARRIEKVRTQLMAKFGARNATSLVVKLSRLLPDVEPK